MRLLSLFLACFLTTSALAEGRSIIVLDASGSMWGQIDGRPKLEIAREALAQVLSGLPADTEIGLMAYGHRSKGDCNDIELVVPPAAGTAQAISDAANAMKFLGKTPLSDAVRKAAEDLRYTEDKATVILITDGIETCNADPCALGSELDATGVDFTAHVVGFGLTEEEGRAVACLAENTGGTYIQASDAGALVEALKTTVAVAPEPAPEPIPEPEPQPAQLEKNIDPVVLLTEGGTEPEIAEETYFQFFPIGPDGPAADHTFSLYGTQTDRIDPGRYLMRVTLDQARSETEITLTATELAQPVVVLNAGVIRLTLLSEEGGKPDSDAYWKITDGGEVNAMGYGTGKAVLPAGDYTLTMELGALHQEEPLQIKAGDMIDRTVVLGVGVAKVDIFYAEGVTTDDHGPYVQILEAKANIDNERKQMSFNYGSGKSFDLPPGDYVARVEYDAATAETPFTIRSGERLDLSVILNAGVLAVTSPEGNYVQVFKAKPDLKGNREQVAYGYGPEMHPTLPAGDYVVVVESDKGNTETPASVTAGERSEVTTPTP